MDWCLDCGISSDSNNPTVFIANEAWEERARRAEKRTQQAVAETKRRMQEIDREEAVAAKEWRAPRRAKKTRAKTPEKERLRVSQLVSPNKKKTDKKDRSGNKQLEKKASI